ncbi:uncharacterized protein [Dermacentor andersoni]|uniref:uncharacterized protein n=1 Tax=Dermacentor andersoni TaxID=34620 RepID=UPI003B3AA7ED
MCRIRIEGLGLTCPIDSKRICFEDAASLCFNELDLADYTVRCFNADFGCQFEGRLSVLKQHFLERCSNGETKCCRCERTLPQWQVVEHRAECKVGLLPAAIKALELVHQKTDGEAHYRCTTTQSARSPSDRGKRKAKCGDGTVVQAAGGTSAVKLSGSKRTAPLRPEPGTLPTATFRRGSTPDEECDVGKVGKAEEKLTMERTRCVDPCKSESIGHCLSRVLSCESAGESTDIGGDEPKFEAICLDHLEHFHKKSTKATCVASGTPFSSTALPHCEAYGGEKSVPKVEGLSTHGTMAAAAEKSSGKSLTSSAVNDMGICLPTGILNVDSASVVDDKTYCVEVGNKAVAYLSALATVSEPQVPLTLREITVTDVPLISEENVRDLQNESVKQGDIGTRVSASRRNANAGVSQSAADMDSE